MKVKRFLLNALIMIFPFLLIFIAVGVVAHIIYVNIVPKELKFQEGYEYKKQICDELRTVARNCIEEGKGINIQVLNEKEIKYNISNVDNNIRLYCYEEHAFDIYNATITLSSEFEILKEEYSLEEDYEIYKKSIKYRKKLESILYAIVSVTIIIYVIKITYNLWKKAKK